MELTKALSGDSKKQQQKNLSINKMFVPVKIMRHSFGVI